MAEQINALLVYTRDDTFKDLLQVLKALDIKVLHARSCREASHLLKDDSEIDLVFAGTGLQDGVWADVLDLAQGSRSYLPVIVVSRMVDVGFYLEVLEKGAFDFVTPPFRTSDIAHIVRSAIYKGLVSVKQDLAAPPVA